MGTILKCYFLTSLSLERMPQTVVLFVIQYKHQVFSHRFLQHPDLSGGDEIYPFFDFNNISKNDYPYKKSSSKREALVCHYSFLKRNFLSTMKFYIPRCDIPHAHCWSLCIVHSASSARAQHHSHLYILQFFFDLIVFFSLLQNYLC